VLTCDVIASSMQGYGRDRARCPPRRGLLKSTASPTPPSSPGKRILIFDSVRYRRHVGCFVSIDSEERPGTAARNAEGNTATVRRQGRYFPVPPVDALQDIRPHVRDAGSGRHGHERANH